MSDLLLKVSGLNKSFFGVQVLRDVGFELTHGAVLGLVGENGSGKSTTMNILGGVLTRDSGRVELAGEEVAPANSRDALALGIAFIHQELSFPESQRRREHLPRSFSAKDGPASVHQQTGPPRAGEEGARTDRPPRLSGDASHATSAGRTTACRNRQSADPAGPPHNLRRTDNLAHGARDRTAVRDYQSAAAQGISIIYISHILGDVLRLCDNIVVLRDGRVVGGGPGQTSRSNVW